MIPVPGAERPQPTAQVHKVHYTDPNGIAKAITLTVVADQLVIVPTGDAQALAHFPVIRGTPWQRVSPPELVDDHKQKEAWFYLFEVDEILEWAEHHIVPLSAITAVERRTEDDSTIPVLTVYAGDAVHRFSFRLVSTAKVDQLEAALTHPEN
jgi:hypothetical protein